MWHPRYGLSGKSLQTSFSSVAPLPKAAFLVALHHPSLSCANCLHLTIPTLFKSLQWELRYRQKHISVFMQNVFNYRPITMNLQCGAHMCGVPDMNFQENASNRS